VLIKKFSGMKSVISVVQGLELAYSVIWKKISSEWGQKLENNEPSI
jgi:hypothetical protein